VYNRLKANRQIAENCMSTVTSAISEEPYPTAAHYLSLLIVDDESWIRNSCKEVAESIGFKAHTAENGTIAIQQLELHSIDVVMLDIKLPGHDGLELLLKIKQRRPETEVIMITGHATVDSVLTAVKSGAYDYLRKPFDLDELKLVLERVTEHLRLSVENRITRESLKNNPGYGGMVGRSPEMEKLYRIIAKVASSRHPVLVQGESGSGKEMVARAIHFTGPFRDKPFISVDCGALVPTLLESELFGYVKGAFTGAVRSKEGFLAIAKGGTVFLDEIAGMPVELQTKLLRALQEREIRPAGSTKPTPIDVRIIAATNRDLEIAMHQGSFRRDLYSRLNIVSLRLPTLRERKEDIRLLVDYFLERISRSKGLRHSISPDAMKQLLAYDWPGNVRELENCLERAATLSSGPVLNVSDLSPQVQNENLQVIPISSSAPKAGIVPLAELEKQAIIGALAQLKGDKLMTAKLLGIGKTTLYRKLREYGITDRWDLAVASEESKTSRQAG
jgi:DNA-binding NtrC family response regulator